MKRKAFKVIYSSTTSVPNGVINFLNHKATQVLFEQESLRVTFHNQSTVSPSNEHMASLTLLFPINLIVGLVVFKIG